MKRGSIDMLVVEGDPRRRRELNRMLRRCDCSPVAVGSADELRVVLERFDVAQVLIGTSGDASDHIHALRLLRNSPTRILVLTDTGASSRVQAYMRLGPHVRLVEPTSASIAASARATARPMQPAPRPKPYRKRQLSPLPGALGHAIVKRRTLSQ